MGQQYFDRWAFVVSDAIHQTRSALDNAVFALWIDHSGEPKTERESRAIAYPIYTDPSAYRRRRSALVGGCAAEAIRLIDDQQPFNLPDGERDQHRLVALREMSNLDKHRAPRVVAIAVEQVGVGRDDQLLVARSDGRRHRRPRASSLRSCASPSRSNPETTYPSR